MTSHEDNWKTNGVRIIPGGSLDQNTPQSPGMTRAAAINCARVGAQKIWAGTVRIEPNARTGPHHHGSLESVIYVVRGRARMRWGEHLEYTAEAGPGDFIYIPPYVPHQERNLSDSALKYLHAVLSDYDKPAPARRPTYCNWSQQGFYRPFRKHDLRFDMGERKVYHQPIAPMAT